MQLFFIITYLIVNFKMLIRIPSFLIMRVFLLIIVL